MTHPRTVSGKPTHNQISMSRMIVVNGSACVDPVYHATVLMVLHTTKNGKVNTHDVTMMFHTQFTPSIALYM